MERRVKNGKGCQKCIIQIFSIFLFDFYDCKVLRVLELSSWKILPGRETRKDSSGIILHVSPHSVQSGESAGNFWGSKILSFASLAKILRNHLNMAHWPVIHR